MTSSRLQPLRTLLCVVLCAGAVALPSAGARAELLTARDALERVDLSRTSATDARQRVQTLLARADVAAELTRLGVDPDEARARVAALADHEIRALDGRLAEVPAGGSFLGVVGAIVLVTLAVLLFTDLLAYTDVYPFIDPLPRGDQK